MNVRRGLICPACGEPCYEYTNGKLSEHKTDNFVPGQRAGGRVRERCIYSDGTWDDARKHVTPLRRKMIDEHARGGPT